MKYQKYDDGTECAIVWLPIRLERVELAAIRKMAKEEGLPWHSMLQGMAALAIENEVDIYRLENEEPAK